MKRVAPYIESALENKMKVIISGRWNRFSSARNETKRMRVVRDRFEKAVEEDDFRMLVQLEDAVTELLLGELENTGVAYVSDGGFRWDSIFDIARCIDGCTGFAQLTRIPETNHFHRQPVAKLPLRRKGPILLGDLRFARQHTTKPIVMCLPGPFSLALQTQNVDEIGLYELGIAYANVLNGEIKELLQNGASTVRIEEHAAIVHPKQLVTFEKITDRLLCGTDTDRVALMAGHRIVESFPYYFHLPYGIFFTDFTKGKQNARALEHFPSRKILIAGIFDAQHTIEENTDGLEERIEHILRYGVPPENIMLGTNTDLHFLPWDEAIKKVKRMVSFGESVDVQALSRIAIPSTNVVLPDRLISHEECRQKLRPYLAHKIFPTSSVGSFPQHPEVRKARFENRKGNMSAEEYEHIVALHTARWMDFQKEIDMTVPVTGELLRPDMAVHFSLAFGGILCDFVPSYENRCYQPIEYREEVRPLSESVTVGEFVSVAKLTHRPLKATITGPATLAHWALLRNKKYYKDPYAFRADLVRALKKEIEFLINAGARVIQIDEPALTTDTTDSVSMDLEAIYETIVEYCDKAYCILHLCYSDMGELDRAFPHIVKLPFHQIHVEMANRNYIMLELIQKYGFGGKDIGLGVLDVHNDRIETVDEIVRGVERVRTYFTPEQIWLLPDRGLKERSDEVAQMKLRVMAEAAEICRKELA